jgi:high-affinity Fe2+/Pb2+ permease
MGQQNVNIPQNDGSSGMGAGMIVGLVLAVIIIVFIIWYFLANSGGGGTPTPSSFLLSHLMA